MRTAARSGLGLLLLLLASCSTEPATQRCIRSDVGSMGSENAFRLSVPADASPPLDDKDDRMDVALSVVPPLVAPVTLLHSVDGKEVARWELDVIAPVGLSTRCRIGATKVLSTCGAVVGDLPHSTAGDWSIEPRGNRVLEVGLSFRTCR
jgi:hypothetical protein